MKTIYLLRHAKSSWKQGGLADLDRPLAKRGRRAAKLMADHLLSAGIEPAQILCSPSVRTRETLAAIEKRLAATLAVRIEKALYLADAPALLRRIRRLSDSLPTVMLIGHNPGLETLALMLLPGSDRLAGGLAEKFPTGALCVLVCAVDRWRDVGPATATLDAFVRPGDLDAV